MLACDAGRSQPQGRLINCSQEFSFLRGTALQITESRAYALVFVNQAYMRTYEMADAEWKMKLGFMEDLEKKTKGKYLE